MMDRAQYTPGPASGAQVRKDGEKWTLILVRELRHVPEKVWQALTDPAHLREWAPFDVDGSLGVAGTTVKLTAAGAPGPQVSETTVKHVDAPNVLEYNWGAQNIRWELEASGGGTRLTLWHNIDRRFISWGAAGWHICFDVLDHLLSGSSIGRIVGPEAMEFRWQQLNAEYAKQFGVHTPVGRSNGRNAGRIGRIFGRSPGQEHRRMTASLFENDQDFHSGFDNLPGRVHGDLPRELDSVPQGSAPIDDKVLVVEANRYGRGRDRNVAQREAGESAAHEALDVVLRGDLDELRNAADHIVDTHLRAHREIKLRVAEILVLGDRSSPDKPVFRFKRHSDEFGRDHGFHQVPGCCDREG